MYKQIYMHMYARIIKAYISTNKHLRVEWMLALLEYMHNISLVYNQKIIS